MGRDVNGTWWAKATGNAKHLTMPCTAPTPPPTAQNANNAEAKQSCSRDYCSEKGCLFLSFGKITTVNKIIKGWKLCPEVHHLIAAMSISMLAFDFLLHRTFSLFSFPVLWFPLGAETRWPKLKPYSFHKSNWPVSDTDFTVFSKLTFFFIEMSYPTPSAHQALKPQEICGQLFLGALILL